MPDWKLEAKLWKLGYGQLAGVDEAGRGALAGPVVAAAVILPYRKHYPFRDSKTLSADEREALSSEIKETALCWAVGVATAGEVDGLNVLKATHLAAARALGQIHERGWQLAGLVTDYLRLEFAGPVLAVPKGDQRSYQVAAAGILAKTTRDALMREYDGDFPAYGFAKHKGYGSPEHLKALRAHGPCELHRMSFRPVAQPALF